MKRITMEVPDGVRERLERLKVQSDAGSYVEVIRRALAVYETILDVDVAGGRVLLETEDQPVRQLLVR